MHFLPFTKSSYLKPTLKLSALSVMVAALSGCGEDAKDCGGFWDKTFGREECVSSGSSPLSPTTTLVTAKTKGNVITLDLANQEKLISVEPQTGTDTQPATVDVNLVFANNTQVATVQLGQILMLEPSSKLPFGLLAKVESVVADKDKVTLGLNYASLTDAFTQLSVKIDKNQVDWGVPVFYPAANLDLQPTDSLLKKANSKSSSTSEFSADFIKYDPKERKVELKPTLKFSVEQTFNTQTLKKYVRPVKNCENSIDACMDVSMPIEIVLSDLVIQEPIEIQIDNGELTKYKMGLKTKMDSSITFNMATPKKTKSANFVYSLADAIRAVTPNSKITGHSVQEKRSLAAGAELLGVPYDDDKILLGTLVWSVKTVVQGIALGGVAAIKPDTQSFTRNVPASPAIIVSFFMNAKGEIKAKAEMTYKAPQLDIGALVQLETKNFDINLNPFADGSTFISVPYSADVIDGSNYMKRAKPNDVGSITLGVEGSASVATSTGVDIGIAMFNINPANWSGEFGVKMSLGGKLNYNTNAGFTGCSTGLQLGAGVRSFIDVQGQLKTAEKRVNWSLIGVEKLGGGEYGYVHRWPLYQGDKDNENWDLDWTLTDKKTEDSCHRPIISHADWQGGNFISGQYPISFDASSTRHQPLIKSVQWDFGDGQKSEKFEDEKIKEGLKPVHTYTKEGIYTATLSVIYDDYGEDTIHTAEWKNIPIKKPAAAIDNYPASGLTGVIGICTTCIEGLISYDIDWGDGKVESFIMGNQDAQHKHAYASEGSKLVVLTLKDKFNNTFQEARTINVSKSVMAIQNGTTQKAGQAVGFSMEKVFSDATSVFWRFFNSIGDAVQSFLKSVSEQVSVAFEDSGDYKAVAEVRSSQGVLETIEKGFKVVSVSKLVPSQAIADKKAIFSLMGSNLDDSLVISLENCDNLSKLDVSATRINFECTPKVTGTRTLQVKNESGVLLWSTDVRFEYVPIQPEQPTQGFSYITEPLAFMNQGSRYNSPSYWINANPVELASYSIEYVKDVNKFAVKTYATKGSSSNTWMINPLVELVFSIQDNKWIEIEGGEKQATEGLIGTSGIKTVNITDSNGIQYYTMLERDLTGKMLVEGITSGFGDGRQLPNAAYKAQFSNGARAYTWIRDVLTPVYSIELTHYVFTTRHDVLPIYTCINIGSCSTDAETLEEAVSKQAWIRNGGQNASVRIKAGNQAELLVTDPVTKVNSMYIINYQLINATVGNPKRIIFDTPETVAKKALNDYFGTNDVQLAWYEYNGQVVRGSYQPPIKGQVSQSYQYNKAAINDILTKWFPSKSPVLD